MRLQPYGLCQCVLGDATKSSMNVSFDHPPQGQVAGDRRWQSREFASYHTAKVVDHLFIDFERDQSAKSLLRAHFDVTRARVAHSTVGGADILSPRLIAQEPDVALHGIDQTELAGRVSLHPAVAHQLIDPLTR